MDLVGGWLNPSEKYEFVNWDDDYSQYMEKSSECSKAPTRRALELSRNIKKQITTRIRTMICFHSGTTIMIINHDNDTKKMWDFFWKWAMYPKNPWCIIIVPTQGGCTPFSDTPRSLLQFPGVDSWTIKPCYKHCLKLFLTCLNMLAPNPTFAHTQRTHPNNIVYLSSEDEWKHWLF